MSSFKNRYVRPCATEIESQRDSPPHCPAFFGASGMRVTLSSPPRPQQAPLKAGAAGPLDGENLWVSETRLIGIDTVWTGWRTWEVPEKEERRREDFGHAEGTNLTSPRDRDRKAMVQVKYGAALTVSLLVEHHGDDVGMIETVY